MVKLLDLQKITMAHAEEYKAAVNRVVESGWFLQGKENQQFEHDYAEYIGTSECVAVANGLDALKLIIRGYKELGIFHDGDEIIVPANTYIATILAITDNHLVPVLVEPTWEHLEIDIDKIEEAITPKTRGIMIVHLYGRIAYNDLLGEICQKHGLKLMEDCAQSHGCGFRFQDSSFKRTGALGDAAAHSFYPGKNLGALGDAGAVTTDDKELAAVIRALANYGSQKKYVFRYAGMNSRMSEIDAAVLDVKLKYLDEDNRRRQQLAAYYYKSIDNPLITLPQQLNDENNVYHQFPIFCERRDELQAFLTEHSIQTLIHYPIPPHKQECYKEWNDRSYPITEKIHQQELSIPMNQVITEEEAQEVVKWLNAFL
jgi:dTDP-4-amino-4,6-dideoxygalactose transaminase